MKKVITSLALMSVILITSCNNKNVDFYNKLVDINDAIKPQRVAFGNEVTKAEKADSATLVKIIDTLIPTLKEGMGKIKALQSEASDGKDLQQRFYALDSAILVSVEAVKKMVTVKMSEEETNTLNNNLINSAPVILSLDSSLQKSIAAYIKANDITLEKK
jgi:hypothetical protein